LIEPSLQVKRTSDEDTATALNDVGAAGGVEGDVAGDVAGVVADAESECPDEPPELYARTR
jgi:hypothetical protein